MLKCWNVLFLNWNDVLLEYFVQFKFTSDLAPMQTLLAGDGNMKQLAKN